MTRVAVLTPPGTGAVATVAVVGPAAWDLVRTHFRPHGKPLPESPPVGTVRVGRLGAGAGDEVVLAVAAPDRQEVHCHGGRQVVRMLVELFVRGGCDEVGWQSLEEPPTPSDGWAWDARALEPLTLAPTVRTAGMLLDQCHGAFRRVEHDPAARPRLARLAAVGRHLVAPWRVAVCGPPNVGKSSLVNALAGFTRSVVAPTAGTTRDVVGVSLAFDGWPVELLDTAGLRDSSDELEAAGVGRAHAAAAGADLVVWVLDAADPRPVLPPAGTSPLVVLNKTDQPPGSDWDALPAVVRVSALTGAGLDALSAELVRRLVPDPPEPGEAVPFTPALADAVERAAAPAVAGTPAAGPAGI